MNCYKIITFNPFADRPPPTYTTIQNNIDKMVDFT